MFDLFMKHVYPKDEEARHDLHGTGCSCRPNVLWDEAEAVVVHRSWNGRELIEEAEKIIQKENEHEGSDN